MSILTNISTARLPAPALMVRTGVHIALGMLGVILVAQTISAEWGLPAQSLMQAVAVYTGISVFVCIQLRNHMPQRNFGAANFLTLIRAVIVSLFAGIVGHSALVPEMGAWLLVYVGTIALILDGIDGWIARRLRLHSLFGARFDLEVDAAFIFILSLLVWDSGKVGAWVLLGGAMRYLFVFAGCAIRALRQPLPPNRRRQIACVIQTATLLFSLSPDVQPIVASSANGVALTILIISFGRDVRLLLASERAAGIHP